MFKKALVALVLFAAVTCGTLFTPNSAEARIFGRRGYYGGGYYAPAYYGGYYGRPAYYGGYYRGYSPYYYGSPYYGSYYYGYGY